MRHLLVKDLRVLARSPLLVALLVLYPVVLAVLIGFALSRGPDKPRVAFLNLVADPSAEIDLGGESIDVGQYSRRLFGAIEPVRVANRSEARRKVEEGEVLGALIIPADVTQKLQSGLEPAEVEVLYNAEDPVKARFVRDTIKSQVQDANTALTTRFTAVALSYLDLLLEGGTLSLLGSDVPVLGLARTEQILRSAQEELPARSPARAQVEEIIGFAEVARRNAAFTDDVLSSLAEPIRVRTEVVEGGSTPLSSFAVALAVTVSLMFITLLLAAGLLSAEREENAFRRLVRGLVSRTGIVVEKAGLAAVCGLAVALLMLAGLGLFVGLDFGRFPLWALSLAAGALAFGAAGVALGALAREVRTASLLAFMVSLPVAFLALVPSGAVSGGLYAAIRAISAAFPFRPTLDAMDAALNDTGTIWGALLHLLALTVVFAVVGRLALRRFD